MYVVGLRSTDISPKLCSSGARIRTHDLWIRKRVCYPIHRSASVPPPQLAQIDLSFFLRAIKQSNNPEHIRLGYDIPRAALVETDEAAMHCDDAVLVNWRFLSD